MASGALDGLIIVWDATVQRQLLFEIALSDVVAERNFQVGGRDGLIGVMQKVDKGNETNGESFEELGN